MKKLLCIMLLCMCCVLVFAENDVAYKIKNISKTIGTVSYTADYPYFDAKSPLGNFANSYIAKDLKETDRVLADFSETFKAEDKYTAACVISRNDEMILSGYYKVLQETGKEIKTYYFTFNFGYVDGKPKFLTSKDCFKNIRYSLWTAAYGDLSKNPKTDYIKEGRFDIDNGPADFEENFVITKNNISFIVNPGVLAPEKNGSFIFKMRYIYK